MTIEEADEIFDILIYANKLIGSHHTEIHVLFEKRRKLSIWETIKLSMELFSPQWFWRIYTLWQTHLLLELSVYAPSCHSAISIHHCSSRCHGTACPKSNSALGPGSAKPFSKFAVSPNRLTMWKDRVSGEKRWGRMSPVAESGEEEAGTVWRRSV